MARAIIDLIKDERDNGQVLKVTYEEGVEYVNFADVSDFPIVLSNLVKGGNPSIAPNEMKHYVIIFI